MNNRMANTADQDETARMESSHLDLHCLKMSVLVSKDVGVKWNVYACIQLKVLLNFTKQILLAKKKVRPFQNRDFFNLHHPMGKFSRSNSCYFFSRK